MKKKIYYKDLDFIRLIACIAVLLYHLNILKGGYLAVCTFFVLSGYLSTISLFKKNDFNLFSYYSNRFKKIYLPLLIVVFISIAIVSLFCNDIWLNLKPETTSILFGYNNFWQINANLDYFARHINSPFMHLWYIAILIQFDFIFPFIYIIFKKIGEKTKKIIPCIILIILTTIFTIYFYKTSITNNIMITYYNTFSRIFSLLFGVSLGFIHSYYKNLIPKQKYITNRIIFYLYLLILFLLFIKIDSNSNLFSLAMIITTIISCRLIKYGTYINKESNSLFNKIINFFSNISYEIYLTQYPIIFLFSNININNYLKISIIIILTILISFIINFIIKDNKFKKFKILLASLILVISLYGLYIYVLAKNYTEEMNLLEKQLQDNEQILIQKQNEYEKKFNENKENFNILINDIENIEKNLNNIITNLSIIGIGDSIMLGTIDNLYQQFPNGYFDAQKSRTAWVVTSILKKLESKNILGEPILLGLGTNGDCPYEEKIKILNYVKDKKIFWINVSNDKNVRVNKELNELSKKYKNLYIIDWEKTSKNHKEYFVSDGIHLSSLGKEIYTKLIYDEIYKVYLEEILQKKEEIINNYEQETKNKISFYGNDILLNLLNYIQNDFNDSKFIINNEFNYNKLKDEIMKAKENNNLTNKIVFAFDENFVLKSDEYKELINLCLNNQIYIISTNKISNTNLSDINYENVKKIHFYEKIKSNNNYLMADKIHLTDEANNELYNILKNTLNE